MLMEHIVDVNWVPLPITPSFPPKGTQGSGQMNGTNHRNNKPNSTGDAQAPNGTTRYNNNNNSYPKRSGNNVHKDVNNGTNQVSPTSTSVPTTINPNLLNPNLNVSPALAIPTINPNLTSNSPPALNGLSHSAPSGNYRGRGGYRGRGSGRGNHLFSPIDSTLVSLSM